MTALLETYKALGDESRLRIISILGRGYFNVQELTAILNLGQSTVSHHLKILSNAGITRKRKEGTWTYYTISKETDVNSSQSVVNHFLSLSQNLNGDAETLHLREDSEQVEEVLNHRRDETRKFFEEVGGQWSSIRPEVSDEANIVQRLHEEIPQDASLVDLGCGSGHLLGSLMPRSGETIGVDYSQAMLDEAAEHLAGQKNLDLRLGHLEHLPVGDSSVDIALAYMVLHHVPEPEAALRDAYRILKPNGKLIIVDLTTHDREEMRERYGDMWLGFDTTDFKSWTDDVGFTKTCTDVLGKEKDVFYLTSYKR